jgi:hypothetical protein
MAMILACAVIASMAGLILRPALMILRLDRGGRMDLKSVRPAFAPE